MRQRASFGCNKRRSVGLKAVEVEIPSEYHAIKEKGHLIQRLFKPITHRTIQLAIGSEATHLYGQLFSEIVQRLDVQAAARMIKAGIGYSENPLDLGS